MSRANETQCRGGPDARELVRRPNIILYGLIDTAAVKDFLTQLREVLRTDGAPVVLEMSTEGGDAEGGRRIAQEVRLCRQWHGRETFFIGKTVVMSAGITAMAAFPPANRFLTPDAVLLVHERRLQKQLDLSGPIDANLQIVRETLALLETAKRLELAGFEELAAGSRISAAELAARAHTNCYLSAQEALDLELIAGIV